MIQLCDGCIDVLALPAAVSRVVGTDAGVCDGCKNRAPVTVFVEVKR